MLGQREMIKPIKRVLLQFTFQENPLNENTLIVEKERHVYTDKYTQLLQRFLSKNVSPTFFFYKIYPEGF